MIRIFKSRAALEVPIAIETYQDKLRRLSGEVLARYQRELGVEIADPSRQAGQYGEAFASADARAQAQIVAEMAAQMLRTPHAMVNVVTAAEQETVAQWSAQGEKDFPSPAPMSESYCKHIIGTGRELVIDDSTRHPLVCDTNSARDGVITSYLGVPIANRAGWIVGVLCVFDSRQRDWSVTDVGMLTQLSIVLTRSLG